MVALCYTWYSDVGAIGVCLGRYYHGPSWLVGVVDKCDHHMQINSQICMVQYIKNTSNIGTCTSSNHDSNMAPAYAHPLGNVVFPVNQVFTFPNLQDSMGFMVWVCSMIFCGRSRGLVGSHAGVPISTFEKMFWLLPPGPRERIRWMICSAVSGVCLSTTIIRESPHTVLLKKHHVWLMFTVLCLDADNMCGNQQ